MGTVHIGTSGRQRESGLEVWRESTPKGFCFAAKGSRFLTHMKKLKDPEVGVGRFFERMDRLGRKLDPIVFHLPPRHRYAFELRNPTWHTPEIFRLLRRHNAAFCIFEIAGFHSNVEITADFTYARLHGPGVAYQGSYRMEALHNWAEWIREWRKELRAVYVYFDNDQAAYAVENARELRKLLA